MCPCSWCGKDTPSNEMTFCKAEDQDKHTLCSSCHLSGHACQSSCPSCWYQLSQHVIERDQLCAGCIEPLNRRERRDGHGHSLCDHCQQCLVCAFREKTTKEFFSLPYRDHEPRIQSILYLMQLCVQRVEVEREPCSICMESLNGHLDNPVRVLDACQHRFHTTCIEKWFRHKPCCPCCRHIYHLHDEPSKILPFSNLHHVSLRLFEESKRMRRDHFPALQSPTVDPTFSSPLMDLY